MKGLAKLLLRYVFASESIFMLLLMPLLIFAIMGEAMIFGLQSNYNDQHKTAVAMISGIAGTTIISSAVSIIPITIVDFKNSVLMKRIGATNIKPWQFVLVIIGLFFIQSTFSFFYTRFIATMLFGSRMGWDIGFYHNVGIGYLYVLVVMLLAISFGLFITAISTTVRRSMFFSRILYMPISILSGGMLPINIIYGSPFLKGLNWANPFRYAIEPYLEQQGALPGYQLEQWQTISYPFIVAMFVILALIIVSKKLKWTS